MVWCFMAFNGQKTGDFNSGLGHSTEFFHDSRLIRRIEQKLFTKKLET